MPEGLSVSRLVNVEVDFTPVAAATLNFDTLLIMGDSGVINMHEMIREYNALEDVASDFGTTAPEYIAATRYFSQIPQPNTLFIGRWARTAVAGELVGGILTTSEKTISNWTAITDGSLTISIDGSAQNLTGLDFSGVTNLNGAASIVDAALTGATVTWNGFNFDIKSSSTGASSTVGFAGTPGSGTNLGPLLKVTSTTAQYLADGVAAETPVAGVARVDGLGWYGLTFAASVDLNTSDHLAVSAYIEAASDKHIYGITTNEAAILDPVSTIDIASQMMEAGYIRTVVQYSSSSLYAIASFFGRAFSVNFNGSNTTITMMYKREPGVIPEILTATQATTLEQKRAIVYVKYNNNTSIIQHGTVSGPAWFDEIHGLDWLANRVQTDVFNSLYQAPKIPQTDTGINILVTACEGGLAQAVTNGLLAPGVWDAPGFGTLAQGKFLDKGWYIYAGKVADQSSADRAARKSPLIQIAAKMAGAVHFANVLISVNR